MYQLNTTSNSCTRSKTHVATRHTIADIWRTEAVGYKEEHAKVHRPPEQVQTVPNRNATELQACVWTVQRERERARKREIHYVLSTCRHSGEEVMGRCRIPCP